MANKFTLFISLLFCLSLLLPSQAQATLKYFGYYNVNGLPPDSRSHIPEIGARGNTNIAIITVSDTTKLPQYFSEMRQNKIFAILGVTAMFETPNWEQNWTNIKEAIKGNEDIIYGFYFDESVWRGVDISNFRMYTKRIRTDFPTKATMLIEAYPPVIWGTIPDGYLEYITDFGFDYYTTVESHSWNSFLGAYGKIYHLSAYKNVWLIPDGYGYPSSSTSNLGTILENFYQLGLAQSEVIGMIVFRYDPGDGSYYTAQDVQNPSSQFYNPFVLDTYNRIGKAIIANGPAYPTPPSKPIIPGDLNQDGAVNLVDFHLLLTKFGNPYTIFNFNDIVNNYGK